MQFDISLQGLSLRRSQAFLDTHAAELAGVNVAAPRAELDDAVRQLSAHAANQDAAATTGGGDTLRLKALIDSLRKDHMGPIAQIARQELRGTVQFADIKLPRTGAAVQTMVDAGRGLAQVAQRYEAVFVRADRKSVV